MDKEQLLRHQLLTAVAIITTLQESLENDGEIGAPELVSKMLTHFLEQSDAVLNVTGVVGDNQ